jgi:hypothetical protein
MKVSVKERYQWLKRLRWIARIASILSVAVILMFLFGEEFDVSKITANQWLGFLFFPVGLIAGFIIGWKKEMLGGIISILSLLGFYFIYGLLVSGRIPQGFAFIIFALPGFLFLACGIYAYFAIGKLADQFSNNAVKD